MYVEQLWPKLERFHADKWTEFARLFLFVYLFVFNLKIAFGLGSFHAYLFVLMLIKSKMELNQSTVRASLLL